MNKYRCYNTEIQCNVLLYFTKNSEYMMVLNDTNIGVYSKYLAFLNKIYLNYQPELTCIVKNKLYST